MESKRIIRIERDGLKVWAVFSDGSTDCYREWENIDTAIADAAVFAAGSGTYVFTHDKIEPLVRLS